MRIQIVSFHCTVKNNLGQVLSTSTNQDVVTTLDEKEVSILPGFASALQGLKQGEKRRVKLSAEQAYGLYDPELQIAIPRSKLARGKELKIEDQVVGRFTNEKTPRVFRVVSEDSKKVLLDGNHPLAGQDLVFDIEVTSAREEIEKAPEQFEFFSEKHGILN